jgi:hypothetical protein
MSLESQIADIFRADAQMMSILLGGVYTSEEVGVEGIRRGEDSPITGNLSPTKAAFDVDGEILPCALVVELDTVGYGELEDMEEKTRGVSTTVSISYYQRRGHATIKAAALRGFTLLYGTRLTRTYPLMAEIETAPLADIGPIKNSMTIVQPWMIVQVRRP